jgi:hypothetical protein
MAQKKNNTSLDKQIRDAINQLTADGKPVTNQTVRDAIGGGSFRDIGPVVKLVKAEIEAKEEAARAAPPMPEDFSDAASAMWDLSWRLADVLAASERHGHAVEIDRLRAEVDEALSNCGVVEDERDTAEKRADSTAKLLAEAEAALLDAKFEIARLNGQLDEREKYIESRLAESRMEDEAEAVSGDEPPAKRRIEVGDTPPMTEDIKQLDMFSKGKPGKKKPDDPEPIAAE